MAFRVDDLIVRYDAATALNGVTLHFESGALGLLGPNGAGKTSLLRALLGFVRPASGTVSVLGEPHGADPIALRRRIGYSPEEDSFLPGQNAVSSVSLCGELCGLPRVDSLQRAHEMLFYVGLGEVRYRPVETYSQGMRQRLKLAQALVHGPELLFLDEPTNGLDPKGRQEVLSLVSDLAHAKGMHVVLSSHLLPDVEAVCDEIAVLDTGRLIRSGRVVDLTGGRPQTFEVRIKGSVEDFRAALAERNAVCRPGRHGLIQVESPGLGARIVFEAAAASGSQVRYLVPARSTLSDLFTTATVEGAPVADP